MNTPREILTEFIRWRDSQEHAFGAPDPAAAYFAGREHGRGTLRVPSDANEAALMTMLGMAYLKEHAPERLRSWEDPDRLGAVFYDAMRAGSDEPSWRDADPRLKAAIIVGIQAMIDRMMIR